MRLIAAHNPQPRHEPSRLFPSLWAGLILSLGCSCSSHVSALTDHLEAMTEIYARNHTTPGAGLEKAHAYREAHNPAIASASRHLVEQLSTTAPQSERRAVAESVQATLAPRHDAFRHARSQWQQAAIVHTATGEMMQSLGPKAVQDAETAFDTAFSTVLRMARTVIKRSSKPAPQ